MNLRDMADRDLGFIMEDEKTGVGQPIFVTNPEGVRERFVGPANDISQMIDPETGMVVSGRTVSVSIRLSTLKLRGFETPRGIGNSRSKPWVIDFVDQLGEKHVFKVIDANPDRTIGNVLCILEEYKL